MVGIKFVCECIGGEINTYHAVVSPPSVESVKNLAKSSKSWFAVGNTPSVEQIVNSVKISKGWIGGKFIEAYTEEREYGIYKKTPLDLTTLNKFIAN